MKDEVIISYLKSQDKKKHNEVLSFWEKKYKKRVLGYVYHHCGKSIDGMEIFNTSLFSFFTNIHQLDTFHYSAKLSTYFFRITVNNMNEALRKQKRTNEKISFGLDNQLDRLNALFSGENEQYKFQKLNLSDLKDFVTHSKKVIGEECFKILRFKYSRNRKYPYEELLELFPQYKNAHTIKSTAKRCRDNAKKKLLEYYESLNHQSNE